MKTFLRCAVFSFVVASVLTYFFAWPSKRTFVLQVGMTKEEVRREMGVPPGKYTDRTLEFYGSGFPDCDAWVYDDIIIDVHYDLRDDRVYYFSVGPPTFIFEPPRLWERTKTFVKRILP